MGAEEEFLRSQKKQRRIPRTSHQVLDKMQRVADEQHGGALRENVMEIFESLHPIDRATFLKKSLILHWEHDINIAREVLEDVKIDREISIDLNEVQHERTDLKSLDQEEQIKLKTWMNKAFFIIGVMAFIVMMFLSTVMGSEKGSNLSKMVDALSSVIELVF